MERVICYLPTREGLEVLKTISNKTWIKKLPPCLYELFQDHYESSLIGVGYVPMLYFYLDEELKKDKKIIKRTIKGFRKYGKLKQLDLRQRPLVLKKGR